MKFFYRISNFRFYAPTEMVKKLNETILIKVKNIRGHGWGLGRLQSHRKVNAVTNHLAVGTVRKGRAILRGKPF